MTAPKLVRFSPAAAPLPRRAALVLAAAGGLALLRPGLAMAAAVTPDQASQFIQTTGAQLVGVLNSDDGLAAKRSKVAGILNSAVDVQGVGRFILGRWWRVATPAEQQEYNKLFADTLIRNLSARFGEYKGVQFAVGRRPQQTEDDVLVDTQVRRVNQQPFDFSWRVANVNGALKVVDVVAEGTSLRLTQRSEYSSVIQRNGGKISALLDAMRQQIAQLEQREKQQ